MKCSFYLFLDIFKIHFRVDKPNHCVFRKVGIFDIKYAVPCDGDDIPENDLCLKVKQLVSKVQF